MKEQSRVQLSKPERQELQRLLQSGLQPVRTVLRALALRQMAEGQTVRQVAKNVGLTPKTVWLTSQRYRQSGLVGCTAPATHRSLGLWSSAGRPLALDRAPTDRRSGKAQTGSARGTRNYPRPAGKPRPKAVAGKKCGAWRNWMRSIASAWRTFWRGMRSREASRSQWFVWMRNRWFCTRTFAVRRRCGPDEWRDAMASTSVVARPTCSAEWNRRLGNIFPR